jgi:hypothetical protein
VTGPLITGREETFWRDGWLAVICIGPGGERGKGYRPRFALAMPFGLVGKDAEEPGAERGTPGEAVDALQDTDPCLWATSSETAWLATKRPARRTSRA